MTVLAFGHLLRRPGAVGQVINDMKRGDRVQDTRP